VVDQWDDEDESRTPRSVLEATEAELHPALVLLEDPYRRAEHHERHHADHGDDDVRRHPQSPPRS
jgi:hypothetical protein